MRKDISKYIGIVHKFNGNDFDGCDCIGLVRLFYKDNGLPQTFWDGGQQLTKDNYREFKSWARLFRYLAKNGTRIKDTNKLSYGDVIVCNIQGDCHLGIYLEYGNVLAMAVPSIEGKSTSTIYHRKFWELCFIGGYHFD